MASGEGLRSERVAFRYTLIIPAWMKTADCRRIGQPYAVGRQVQPGIAGDGFPVEIAPGLKGLSGLGCSGLPSPGSAA